MFPSHDQEEGIDWINRLGSKNQQELLELDLRNIISQSFGVTAILDVSVNVTDRVFSGEYTIQTIYSKSYTDLIEVLTT